MVYLLNGEKLRIHAWDRIKKTLRLTSLSDIKERQSRQQGERIPQTIPQLSNEEGCAKDAPKDLSLGGLAKGSPSCGPVMEGQAMSAPARAGIGAPDGAGGALKLLEPDLHP